MAKRGLPAVVNETEFGARQWSFFMSLISCPECGREISTEAVACPQCGHPNRPADELKCYACERPATVLCQRCNEPSCLRHVQNYLYQFGISVPICQRCQASYARFSIWAGVVLTVIAVVLIAILFMVAR